MLANSVDYDWSRDDRKEEEDKRKKKGKKIKTKKKRIKKVFQFLQKKNLE